MYNYNDQKKEMMEGGNIDFLKILFPIYEIIKTLPKGTLVYEEQITEKADIKVGYDSFTKKACIDILVEIGLITEVKRGDHNNQRRIFEKD